MKISADKKIICITGSLWTQKHDAPRHLLVKEGFVRPRWFTTGRPLSDASYKSITESSFHVAAAESKVLAQMKYGGDYTGILKRDFQEAIETAEVGVLVVGFQEIVAKIAQEFPKTVIFAFKQQGAELSKYLDEAVKKRQVHRLDVDVLEVDAWNEIMEKIQAVL